MITEEKLQDMLKGFISNHHYSDMIDFVGVNKKIGFSEGYIFDIEIYLKHYFHNDRTILGRLRLDLQKEIGQYLSKHNDETPISINILERH